METDDIHNIEFQMNVCSKVSTLTSDSENPFASRKLIGSKLAIIN